METELSQVWFNQSGFVLLILTQSDPIATITLVALHWIIIGRVLSTVKFWEVWVLVGGMDAWSVVV